MADINTSTRRFENGGIFQITESATATPVLLIVPGSISWTPSFRSRIEFTDRGVQQTPMEGDDILSEISVQVYTGKFHTSELYTLLMSAGASGSPQLFDSLLIKIPDNRSATTGESLTWSNFWLAEPPTFQAGGQNGMDTMTFKLKAKTGPTTATYS